MQYNDYPALYRAADDASNGIQGFLLLSFKCHAFLLFLGALISIVSTLNSAYALVAALLFISSLGIHVNSQLRNFQGRWYRARALAESVKTGTWRFIMRADPFSSANQVENLAAFQDLLMELLKDNKDMGEELSGKYSGSEQVTAGMLAVQRLPYEDRLNYYLRNRVQEQQRWYEVKARGNKRAALVFLVIVIIAYLGAIALLLYRVPFPNTPYLPIDALAVAAGSLVGWVQLRRFNELASAYGLTAHEVGIIQLKAHNVSSDQELNEFVSNSENAFSREHTQWAARRDK